MALGNVRRAAILAAYGVVFWVLLPAGLWLSGSALDARLGWHARPRVWTGGLVLSAGAVLMTWALIELGSHGRGWPVSALPPKCLTRRGPYRHVRHPIYLGFNLALFGAGLVVGSPGLTLVVAPAFAPLWVLYAHGEERALVRRFGKAYRRYQCRVGLLPRPGLYRVGQVLIAFGALPVRVEGGGGVPRRGPAVVVANHASYLDPAYLSAATSRPVHFLTTAEIYRTRLTGWLVRRLVSLPVRRYRPDPAACREMLRLLEDGEVVGVFPEGERSALGDYQGASPQVARVLARLSVPVVPVGICGSYDSGPRWSGVLRRRAVRVRIGTPIRWGGQEPAAVIDAALRSLIGTDPQPVHLAGLPVERLGRVLWRCPRCFEEMGWRASALSCARCGVVFRPSREGGLSDPDGIAWSLAGLGRAVRSAPEVGPLCCPATAWRERSVFGPIRPLDFLAAGVLRAEAEGLRFGDLFLPMGALRSVSTERADTLQVATREGMWQFQICEGSVFRLQAAVERWRQEGRRAPSTATAGDRGLSTGARS